MAEAVDPLDNEFDGNPDGQYMMDLVEAAPTMESLLEQMRAGSLFKGLRMMAQLGEKTVVLLDAKEVEAMLDPKVVDWDSMHTGCLESIFNNRATNETNASTKNKNHTDEKFALQHKLCREYPSFVANASDGKKECWRSGVDALAGDFTRLLDTRLVTGGKELLVEIEKILEEAWQPTDAEGARTVYYIAGAILRMAEDQCDQKVELASVYEKLRKNAAVSKTQAARACLPYQRVAEREGVRLYYPSTEFYHFAVRLESVFYHLLCDESIAVFGPAFIDNIKHVLSRLDIGFAQFLPEASEDEILRVFQRVIEYYGNLRGKDFARKKNARVGASHTETTRATCGTIDYLNNLKKKKREKEQKEAKAKAKATGEGDGEGEGEGKCKGKGGKKKRKGKGDGKDDAATDAEGRAEKATALEAKDVLVLLPPGPLGIALGVNPGSPLVVIKSVAEAAPARGKLLPGGALIEVGGVDVKGWTAIRLAQHLKANATKERVVKVLRPGARPPAATTTKGSKPTNSYAKKGAKAKKQAKPKKRAAKIDANATTAAGKGAAAKAKPKKRAAKGDANATTAAGKGDAAKAKPKKRAAKGDAKTSNKKRKATQKKTKEATTNLPEDVEVPQEILEHYGCPDLKDF